MKLSQIIYESFNTDVDYKWTRASESDPQAIFDIGDDVYTVIVHRETLNRFIRSSGTITGEDFERKVEEAFGLRQEDLNQTFAANVTFGRLSDYGVDFFPH